jgi:hypothetical protein
MKSRFLPKLSYSNVIATMALFIALGGAAVAAGLPRNSVGASQLKRGAVTAAKLKRGAIVSGKLAPKSVIAGKLGANAVLPGNIGNGAITSAKIGAGAVIASSIKNNVVTSNKLNDKAVTTNKLNDKAVTTGKLGNEAVTAPILANGSITPAKLSKEFGALINPLKTGQTLQGSFAIGGAGEKMTVAIDGESFQFPLANAPAATVIPVGGPATPGCPGAGSVQAPSAVAGNLCLYVTSATNLKTLTAPGAGLTRLGFALEATAEDDVKPFSAYGQWAVTAP